MVFPILRLHRDPRSSSILFARMGSRNSHGIGIAWQFTQWVTDQPRRTLMPTPPSLPARLPFEIDDRIAPTLITAHAGVPLVIELFRQVGAAQVVHAQVRSKQRQRGLLPAQVGETLIALWAAGGDRGHALQTFCGLIPRWPPCWAMSCPRPPRYGPSWRRFMWRIPRCSVLARRRPCLKSQRP